MLSTPRLQQKNDIQTTNNQHSFVLYIHFAIPVKNPARRSQKITEAKAENHKQ
jgi:hypothetical protein